MARGRIVNDLLDRGAVAESNAGTGRVDRELARDVAGNLGLIREQEFLELTDVLERAAVGQFPGGVDREPEMEGEGLAIRGRRRPPCSSRMKMDELLVWLIGNAASSIGNS